MAGIFALLLWAATAFAATYPALTGRVVDGANILSAGQKSALEGKLTQLESQSGIQLVVATVSSLNGQEIEPYANELFRTWKLGEVRKDNGVLLLVAPNDKRVRIEVGYGLEGTLTDALSKVVIANAITPRFKTGDFDGGVARGVDDIITILTTDSADWKARLPDLRLDSAERSGVGGGGTQAMVLFLLLVVVIGLSVISPVFRSFAFNFLQIGLQIALSAGSSSGGGRGGGGGFSGGGGSSGGGGASGSW